MKQTFKVLFALVNIFLFSISGLLSWIWPEVRLKSDSSLFPLEGGIKVLSGEPARLKMDFAFALVSQKEEQVIASVVKEATIQKSVRKAISLAGGLGFIKPGDAVLIKPNVNSYDPYPGTTNPRVVGEVVRMVKEAGAKRVIVADRSGPGRWSDTMYNMETVGIAQAAREAGAEVIALEKKEWVRVRPEGAKYWEKGFKIPRLLEEVDHIINLPVVKTHSLADFSMSLKNFVGLISMQDRGVMHGSKYFKEMIAELNLAFQPKLNVMDASKVFVSGGPATGETRSPGMIIASPDRIATDLTGLTLLKILGTTPAIQSQNMWNHPQIKRAGKLEIGVSTYTGIRLRSSGVESDKFLPYLQGK